MNHDRILILDFGSQVTQLIARRVREAHVYCEVHPNDVSEDFIREFAPKGIILSGSYMSAYEESNDQASPAVFSAAARLSLVRSVNSATLRSAPITTRSCWKALKTSRARTVKVS